MKTRAAPCFLFAPVLAIACGGASTTGPAHEAAPTAAAAAPSDACNAYFTLEDLEQNALSSPTFVSASQLSNIAEIDEEVGVTTRAISLLRTMRSPEASSLASDLAINLQTRAERRTLLAMAAQKLDTAYLAAEKALHEVQHCSGVDLSRDAATPADCADALRLYRSSAHVNLLSTKSTNAVSAHLRELDLNGSAEKRRDILVTALKMLSVEHVAYDAALSSLDREARSKQTEAFRVATDALQRKCENAYLDAARVRSTGTDLRKSTVIVRPRWSDAWRSVATGAQEWFGSGFFVQWTTAAGKTEWRVLTNQHVMAGATEADVTLRDDSKTTDNETTWRAKLLPADPHEDVAVLALVLKEKAPPVTGLRLRTSTVHDEEHVRAAGFPGLQGKPSFQISGGAVSNASFSRSYFQHTAPIDPGNSGGPLLDGDGRVVGMNTLKATHRENVAFAIPTSHLLLALRRAEQTSQSSLSEAVARCNALVGALASPAPALDTVRSFGSDSFYPTIAPRISGESAARRSIVNGEASLPREIASVRAYAEVRHRLDKEGGIAPFQLCTRVTKLDDGSFAAHLHTRNGIEHVLTLAGDDPSLLVDFE